MRSRVLKKGFKGSERIVVEIVLDSLYIVFKRTVLKRSDLFIQLLIYNIKVFLL